MTARIAFVLSALQAGGAERIIALISEEAIRRGWEAVIVSFDRPDDPIFHRYHPGVTFRRLGLPSDSRKLAAPLLLARRVMALRSLMRREKFDVVVSFLTKINAISLLAATGLRIPVIVSERNNPQRQAQSRIWKLLLDRLYPRAAAIVMLTRRSAFRLPRSVRCGAIIIPNPMALPSGVHRPEKRPARTRRHVTGAGRLNEQKGFDMLIDAFAAIADECPEWDLVIWGEGPDRDALTTRIAAHSLEHRISLPGMTTTHGAWINDADIFVLSSRYEGFANVVAEAMAAGLPVISFDCDFGPGEMITPNVDGVLVPAEDIPALSKALVRIIRNDDVRARIGERAKERSADYSITHVTNRWADLIHSHIEHAPR